MHYIHNLQGQICQNIKNCAKLLYTQIRKAPRKIKKMENVTDVTIEPLKDSIYLKPYRMIYNQNGGKRDWDMIKVHDSVAIVIFNITRDVLVLVKQFRPAVYFGNIPGSENMDKIDTNKYPASLGVCIEICAGIIDKKLSWVEIAKEEVLEECGYDVPLSKIEKIASYRSGVGSSGSKQELYYCEVTDDMKVSSGGGIDDELIEVIEMTIPDIKKYITQDHILSPPSFLFAIYWFLHNKCKC